MGWEHAGAALTAEVPPADRSDAALAGRDRARCTATVRSEALDAALLGRRKSGLLQLADEGRAGSPGEAARPPAKAEAGRVEAGRCIAQARREPFGWASQGPTAPAARKLCVRF